MQFVINFFLSLSESSLEHLLALIALGALGLAIFAIHVVFSISKDQR